MGAWSAAGPSRRAHALSVHSRAPVLPPRGLPGGRGHCPVVAAEEASTELGVRRCRSWGHCGRSAQRLSPTAGLQNGHVPASRPEVPPADPRGVGGRPWGGRGTVRVRAGTQATPGHGGRGRGSRGRAGVPLLTPAFIWGLPGSLPALGPSSSTWQRCPLWSRTARSQQGRGPGRAGTSGPTHPVVAPHAVSDSPGSTKSNAAISTPRRLPLVSFAPFEEAESRGDSPCKPEGGDTADPAQRPLSARGAASAGRAPHCTRSASPTANSPPGCEEEGRGLTSRRGRVGRSGKWDLRLPRGSADAREK